MVTPEEARDYLADDLNAEAEEWPDDEEWFYELEDFLRELPPEDSICVRLALYLKPFFDDDPGLDGILYPLGEAVTWEDAEKPGGDKREYLEGLVEALGRDHERWEAHKIEAGEAAEWTLETGPPQHNPID